MISVETDSQFAVDSLMDTACGIAWGIARRPHRFHKGQKRGRGQILNGWGRKGGSSLLESIETLSTPHTARYNVVSYIQLTVGGSEL